MAQDDVLRDGEIAYQNKMLVDHGYAIIYGVMERTDGCRAAVNENPSLVGFIKAEQNFHQGGFAGAVLA